MITEEIKLAKLMYVERTTEDRLVTDHPNS
jgi:hypothetical protein